MLEMSSTLSTTLSYCKWVPAYLIGGLNHKLTKQFKTTNSSINIDCFVFPWVMFTYRPLWPPLHSVVRFLPKKMFLKSVPAVSTPYIRTPVKTSSITVYLISCVNKLLLQHIPTKTFSVLFFRTTPTITVYLQLLPFKVGRKRQIMWLKNAHKLNLIKCHSEVVLLIDI